MRAILRAALIIGALCQAFGQSVAPARSFEVASVKVRQGAPQWKFAISGTRLTIESFTLYGLVKEAYNLENYQIQRTGAPALLLSNDILYDISAKAEGDGTPTRDEFRQMLQSLLADRFRMKVHREAAETPVYALLIGKDGPKFRESAPDAASAGGVRTSGSIYQWTLPRVTMNGLANTIGDAGLDRPVLDKTGLTGTWDIKLMYTPEFKMSRGPETDLSEISIFTAVQEQLGLRLEPQKAMVEILVVDSVQKPSEN